MNDKTEPWKWGDENQPKPEEPPHIEGQRHLCCGYDAYMRPFDKGNWVRHEDYAKLKMERIHDLNQMGGQCEEIARLKAEVERLTELNATLWKTFWFGFGFACFLFFLFILGIFIIFWKKTLP